MKTASAPLITYLNTSTQFMMADLYQFTLIDGTTITSSSWDRDLTVNSVFYSSNGLKIKRASTKITVGIVVDQLDLTVYPSPSDKVGSLSFLSALNNGRFDGASFTLQRAFLSDATTVVGTISLFTGTVSDADFSGTEANIKVKNYLELLNITMPTKLYQAGCRFTLGDSDCGVNKESYAVAGVCGSGVSNTMLIKANAMAQVTGYFSQGVILFTSGALAGIKRTVLTYTQPLTGAAQIQVGLPLPYAPAVGDTFKIYPGCDKTTGPGGCAFYSNILRYGGFPFIPVPEVAT